jgi:glycosyltransferase involved in cell wall biosynthesis
LPERYLFYPAQFWPHKNHAGIVQALGLLKKDFGAEVHIVFCGSYQGENRDQTFQEMMTLARRLGVAHQVHCPGYVPDEDMSGLYAEAVGLVIPLFLATANIPILEAWAFGCPVLASDIRGVREQVGDAGLLVDPYSVEAISEGIYRLWTDEALRRELAERGRQRLARYTRDDFCRLLADIIREANQRVREGDAKGRGLN